MKRLTYKKSRSRWDEGRYPTKYTSRHTFQEVVARLAAYEDTGLEPEEITDLQRAWDMYGGEEGLTALMDKANAAMPPNDPLTLEELREMGGEPVWARDLTQRFLSGWGIVYENVVEGKSRIYSFVGYGDKWIAYRRKPEGGDCVDR